MPKKVSSINLLPREGFDTTVQGRLLSWALSYFRIIVIVTELVVVVAFLSRFFLDAQNSDLTDEINEKQSLISANASFEKEFRNTQDKLELLRKILSTKISPSKVIDSVVSSIPSDVYLDSMAINNETLTIVGVSPNTQSVQQFIVNLDSKEPIREVGLSSVESENIGSELIRFSLSAKLL